MEKLLQEEFFHLGTDKIYIEQWLYIQMDQIYKNCIKPYGGLWTSHQNDFSLCDWFFYQLQNDVYSKFDYYFLKSCLIKFKENAKLLKINEKNDYKNLKDSGFITVLKEPLVLDRGYYKTYLTEMLNYDKISDYYDLLYVNNDIDITLNNYSIKTMLALTPNSIEYYKPLVVNYEENKILEIKEKEYIKEPTEDFNSFIEYVRSLFYTINKYNYEDYVKELYSLSKDIINKLQNEKNNINLFLQKNISINQVIESVVKNIYREKYREAQKLLMINR